MIGLKGGGEEPVDFCLRGCSFFFLFSFSSLLLFVPLDFSREGRKMRRLVVWIVFSVVYGGMG